jgi:hypothetical protein
MFHYILHSLNNPGDKIPQKILFKYLRLPFFVLLTNYFSEMIVSEATVYDKYVELDALFWCILGISDLCLRPFLASVSTYIPKNT